MSFDKSDIMYPYKRLPEFQEKNKLLKINTIANNLIRYLFISFIKFTVLKIKGLDAHFIKFFQIWLLDPNQLVS